MPDNNDHEVVHNDRMEESETVEGPLSEEEITAFVQKLEQWGQSLSSKEHSLLELLLSRAEGAVEGQDEAENLVLPDVATTTSSLLRRLVENNPAIAQRRRGWVRGGEVWVRNG